MPTITKLSKWGTGQGIRLPKPICEMLDLHIGDGLALRVDNDVIILEKDGESEYSIDRLLANYSGPNPEPYDWGAPVGREEW
ncbi:MAG: AbrB/MazE/SpoVT family DNA-binding domain-containing protein [Actinomycetes bacterium]|nr:AbrB/MazE/SpoVT family DNA-binding domain-containing protein [Actinomycetes bacterium]